jgi:hypothetical protein
VRPQGIKLDDWFAPIGGGIAVAPQAERWFQQWGMDLKAGLDDRNARNESSYRPDGLPKAWYVGGSDVVTFIHGIWLTLEPTAESRFDSIDKHILRKAIEQFFKGSTGKTPVAAPVKFQQLVGKVVAAQNFSADGERQWMEFLTRKTFEADPQLFTFSKESPKGQLTSYASIISRAALLLRVASGATSELLLTAGMTADSTMFWWSNLGLARGLWDDTKSAADLVDLWADIDLLLGELEKFQENYAAQDQSFLRVGRELGPAVIGLGGFERVAIWSMTPSI